MDHSDSEGDVDTEGFDDLDDEGFSPPPGWVTVTGESGRTFTWTNGAQTVGTLTQAWEIHATEAAPEAEDDSDFLSVAALLDSLQLAEDDLEASAASVYAPDVSAPGDLLLEVAELLDSLQPSEEVLLGIRQTGERGAPSLLGRKDPSSPTAQRSASVKLDGQPIVPDAPSEAPKLDGSTGPYSPDLRQASGESTDPAYQEDLNELD